MKRLILMALFACGTGLSLWATETKAVELTHKMDYLISSPSPKDLKALKAEKRDPHLLIAIGRGPGTEAAAKADLEAYWEAFVKKGYHVVMPLVRNNHLYFQGAETHIKPLIESLRKDISFDKVVLAGVSNGGSSTFSIALQNPGDYDALIAIPGMVFANPSFAQALREKPVFLRVGARDNAGWKQGVAGTANLLRQVGARVDFKEVDNAGHVMPIAPQEMIDWLEGVLKTPSPNS